MRRMTRNEWFAAQRAEYKDLVRSKNATPNDGLTYSVKMLGARFFLTVKDWFLTLTWIVTGVAVFAGDNIGAMLLWILAFSVVHFGGLKWKPIWILAGFVGDINRRKKRLAMEKQVVKGEEFVANARMGNVDQANASQAILAEDKDGNKVLTITNSTILEKNPQELLVLAEKWKHLVDGSVSRILPNFDESNPHYMQMTFLKNDPLDIVRKESKPGNYDRKKSSAIVAGNSMGDLIGVPFKGVAGMVISGATGSGKSEIAKAVLYSVICDPLNRVHILDGKGGADWSTFGPLLEDYVSENRNLSRALEFLEKIDQLKTDRLAYMSKHDIDNFHDLTPKEKEQHGLTHEYIVVDEANVFIGAKALKGEQKAEANKISMIIDELTARGRSAGFTVVIIVQKATADSVESVISSNCIQRIAAFASNQAAATAALGDYDPGVENVVANSPKLRGRPGAAVLLDEKGQAQYVRFFFHPKEDLRAGIIAEAENRGITENKFAKPKPVDITPKQENVISEEVADGGFEFEEII